MTDETLDWRVQGSAVAAACRQWLPGLIGVYVHGSAALGGMTDRSDLDVLVISESAAGVDDLARSLLAEVTSPRPLELSVVASAAAVQPRRPWPFLLHVNTAEERIVVDDGTGDPDLIAHYAVTRAAGIGLSGPEPADVIGRIERNQLLMYLRDEMRWGLEHGDQRYAVLNACRAVAYAQTGQLLSKLGGATWWTDTHGARGLVEQARAAQVAGIDQGPATDGARAFVNACISELTAQSQ